MNLPGSTPSANRLPAPVAVAPGVALLHVDDALIAVDKPTGLLSVPGRGPDKVDSMATRVRARWPEADVVHRLDWGTSGLMILARGLEMRRTIGLMFEKRRIDKRYVAVVAGTMADDAGTVELPLRCDWPNRPRQRVDHELGRRAVTHWRVLERSTWPAPGGPLACTRVELEPYTGRSHQLRVHLQQLGHPIIGDELYAPDDVFAAAPRLLLHARWLGFVHPQLGTPLELKAPLPF